MRKINVLFIFLFGTILLSCNSKIVFSLENNGGDMPINKAYKLKLSNDSLFLRAQRNLNLEGEYLVVLSKKEKKYIINKINDLDIKKLKNSKNGNQYFFQLTTEKENISKIIGGFVPFNCKEFIYEMESIIKDYNWKKIN